MQQHSTTLLHTFEGSGSSGKQGYFNNQANGRYFWDKVTRFAPPLLFFLSILAALGHFGYELLAPLLSEVIPTLTKENMVSLGLIVLGACFPVVGAGFRTLRMANEFGRNGLASVPWTVSD
jgi:hypothetical protein